jgi:hypothetical protein
MVDDGSIHRCGSQDFKLDLAVVRSVRIVHLRRNLGHQRAIAIGLAHVERTLTCDAVLVMDADGEDTAAGAFEMIRAFSGPNDGQHAVFAARSRRTESLVFRISYVLYKIVHRILTGVSVRVGNFSILPFRYLATLTVMSELWSHYAAALFRSGLPFATIPIARGHRIAGHSRMNFVSLVTHGLSAISVFGDVLGVRLLIGSLACVAIAVLGIAAVVAIRTSTERAVPGWATYSVGILVVIVTQFMALAMSFTFTILANRVSLGVVPARDHRLFIAGTETVYPHD